MKKSGQWRIGALASAVALLGSVASVQVQALTLGRMTVQSALGETLRAEIDIVDINPEEAASLKATVASPEAFKAAGLDYNAVAASGLDLQLERRPNGRAYLRVLSNRPITEPFVDLIVEAKWASGRISRDYTMLLDPPSLRARAAPLTPNAAQLPRAPLTAGGPAPAARPVAPPARLTPLAPVASSPPAARAPVPERAVTNARQLTVKRGDTAGAIAGLNKPASASLDQMLVALLRSNPEAFIGGNVNRIKSGAVLEIPGAEAASAVSASEARQTIVAQSADFNAFRRKLAASALTTQVISADRQAGGKVQAKVEGPAPASPTPDKLTLSKGQIQGKASSVNEEKIARDKESAAAASRIAELSKNIAELNKLNGVPGTGPSAGQPPVTAAIVVPTPAALAQPAATPAAAAETPPKVPAANAPLSNAPITSASDISASDTSAGQTTPAAATGASQPAPLASAPAPVTAKKSAPPAAPPVPEPGMLDPLLENPWFGPAIALLIALLAALGLHRFRQHKKKGQVDSSFYESRLQPDSFFGASGGQRVDTSERTAAPSSMAHTPSQFDAAGDVDPVAEADVYLAYGRDAQAEEILKEALRSYPARVAIYAKLLEIYAKRQDIKAFEAVATDAFRLTQGYGPEWAHITETGRQLDPANPMYQTKGAPAANARAPSTPAAIDPPTAVLAATTASATQQPVDLDLDFSLDDQPESATMPAVMSVSSPYQQSLAARSPNQKPATPASFNDLDIDLDLDFDLNSDLPADRANAVSPHASSAAHPLASKEAGASGHDFVSHSMDFTSDALTQPLPLTASRTQPAPFVDSTMLEFDMSSLSLDLGPTTQAPDLVTAGDAEDPLEVKFLLAEEFRALGDSDGARSLADEVVAKASGSLKAKAQAFLNALP